MPIFQGRRDADRAVSLVRFDGFLSGAAKRSLCLSHRTALRFGSRKVLAACNRVSLSNFPCLVVDDDLRKLVTLHRVHRELKFSAFDLKLRGDRLALTLTGRESFF